MKFEWTIDWVWENCYVPCAFNVFWCEGLYLTLSVMWLHITLEVYNANW